MVKIFNPTCPRCGGAFHAHHDDLRSAHTQLHCPYCGQRFYVEEADRIVEHDGTVWSRPKAEEKT